MLMNAKPPEDEYAKHNKCFNRILRRKIQSMYTVP
jgi:hypothetical protein